MQHSSFPSPALITKWYCGDYFILPMHLIGQTFWHLLGSSLAFLCLMETWEGVFNHEEYQNGETVSLTFCLHVLMQDKMSLLFSLALPQSSMSNEILDDLLAINVDKVNVEDFNADHSIQSWWKAKTRCPNQQPRKMYKKKQREHDTNTSSDTDSDSSDNINLSELYLLMASVLDCKLWQS